MPLTVEDLFNVKQIAEPSYTHTSMKDRHERLYLKNFSGGRHTNNSWRQEDVSSVSLREVQESLRFFSSFQSRSRLEHYTQLGSAELHHQQQAWTEQAFNEPDNPTHQNKLEGSQIASRHSTSKSTTSLLVPVKNRVPILSGFKAPSNLKGLHFSCAPHRYVRGTQTNTQQVFVVPKKTELFAELMEHNSLQDIARALYLEMDMHRSAGSTLHEWQQILKLGPKFMAAYNKLVDQYEAARPNSHQLPYFSAAMASVVFGSDTMVPTRSSIRKAFKGYKGLQDVSAHDTDRTGILFTSILDLWEYENTDPKAPYALRLLFTLGTQVPTERWMRNNYLAFTPTRSQYGETNYATEGYLAKDMETLFQRLGIQLVHKSRLSFTEVAHGNYQQDDRMLKLARTVMFTET